ncbi:hypothetical protein Trydic_g23803 [Trypoxylus dichotomus]
MYYFREKLCNVKFCVKLGKTFMEAFQLLRQAYGDEVLSRTNDLHDSKVVDDQLKMTVDQEGPQLQLMTPTFGKSRIFK